MKSLLCGCLAFLFLCAKIGVEGRTREALIACRVFCAFLSTGR